MKKFSKVMAIVLVVAMVVALAACGAKEATTNKAANIKVGFIFLHDENSTYDKNFMDAAKAAQAKLGLTDDQVLFKTNVAEGNECYETAAELVDAGCNLVFGDSFGFEQYLMQAAKEFPNVQFCHATGTNAKTANISNYHNAFASIYEGRYLAGVAAGMKINQMISDGKITAAQAKMGYVGAYPYAEVISGYTSFYLGAKSVCPSVTMEVKYTNSWFDISAEKESAQALIKDGCVLISQHADSEGAPKACEEAGVPDVSYNVDTKSIAPNTALIASKINWEPYFELIINAVINGTEIPTDWTGSVATGSVQLLDLNTDVAAPGTQAKLDEVKAGLEAGTVKVFDTSTFTVKGAALTEDYLADVVPDDAYTPDTKVVYNGCFNESTARSAPYFSEIIDGITAVK